MSSISNQSSFLLRSKTPSTNHKSHILDHSLFLGRNIISIVGIGFGDEGKGRAVLDIKNQLALATGDIKLVEMVLKVNGGANSGHTVAGFKHNLIPGGVTDPNIRHLALGRGVVADPLKLLWEVRPLEALGFNLTGRLAIDQRTMVSDLTDRILDISSEIYRNRKNGISRGSTGRGISPAFTNETNQSQIYYDFFTDPDSSALRESMSARVERCTAMAKYVYQLTAEEWSEIFNRISEAEKKANQASIEQKLFKTSDFDFNRFKGSNPFELNLDALVEAYWKAGRAFRSNIVDVSELSLSLLDENKYIIAEHGQAYWLDKRHGFSPNVTASHTYAAEIYQSLNIPLDYQAYVLGVSKAYDTKVGTHLFITEIEEGHPLKNKLKPLEYGTTTGRHRMVGWFDGVEKAYTFRHGGFNGLVINKLDALTLEGDWQGPIKVCTHYQDPEGHLYRTVPNREETRRIMKPFYREYKGWQEDISTARSFNDLPAEAQRYVAGMYDAVVGNSKNNPPIHFIGVGPDPDQIIQDVPSGEELLSLVRQ